MNLNHNDYSSKKVDYVVGFSLSGGSGKEKATQEKAMRLAQRVGRFRLFTASSSGAVSQLIAEIRYLLQGAFSAKPDLIISRSYWGFGAGLLGMMFGIPVVREVHAHMSEEVDILCADRPVRRFLLRFVAGLQLWWFRRSDGLIFNNPLLERFYLDNCLESGRIDTITVANGANAADFYVQDPEPLRERLGLNESSVHLVFCGSVSRWHGVDLLIKFFEGVAKADSRFVLTIVGGGDESFLAQLKGANIGVERLSFVGKVSPQLARDYICAANLCMLPVADIRVSPGSPLKLYDYIACGKPVLAQANMPGYSDVVEAHELGASIDFSNPSVAVSEFLAWYDAVDAEEYQRHNRQKAEADLSWGAVVEQWLAFGFKE